MPFIMSSGVWLFQPMTKANLCYSVNTMLGAFGLRSEQELQPSRTALLLPPPSAVFTHVAQLWRVRCGWASPVSRCCPPPGYNRSSGWTSWPRPPRSSQGWCGWRRGSLNLTKRTSKSQLPKQISTNYMSCRDLLHNLECMSFINLKGVNP